MSRIDARISSKFVRPVAKVASFGILCAIALGSNLAAAQPHKAKVDPRAMQAHSEWLAAPDHCAPANGAQIWGGFAKSGDLIDERTGEICGLR
jgi:hypothetical protein